MRVPWCMVCGVWCVVYGVWCMVGALCMLRDVWYTRHYVRSQTANVNSN